MRTTLTKILLSLAATGAVGAAAIGGTYANFTATPTTISSNAFATGTLEMTRSGTGAVFAVSPAKIGDTATGSVTINNTGSIAGDYSLEGTTTGSSALAGQLNLKIYKDNDGVAGSKIYDGSLGDLSTISLGTFAASTGSHTFYFHLSLPTTGTNAGDNALQGLTTSTTLTWSAVQA